MKLKICGLTNEEDVALAVEAGADYLGFIFVADTPRAIELQKAKVLLAKIPEGIHPVAVILSADVLAQEYLEAGFHYLQVIGGLLESVPRSKQIPVYSVGDGGVPGLDDEGLKLFDTHMAGKHGGTGQCFDLSKIKEAKGDFIVAGGFKPDNLQEVLAFDPFGIDVSSGLEAKPGKKDPEKITQFVTQLRSR